MNGAPPKGPQGIRPYLPAFAAGLSGMVAVGTLLALVLPDVLGGADEATAVRHGAWIGTGLATVVGLAVGLRVVHLARTGGGPLAVMAVGFLVKLFLLAAGVFLLNGPLRSLGDPAAFGVAFVLAVLFFQLLFLPVYDRVLRAHRRRDEAGDRDPG
ncbi:MAG: hypothetical protein R3F30_01900 [Planctomycetota bacterium]